MVFIEGGLSEDVFEQPRNYDISDDGNLWTPGSHGPVENNNAVVKSD